MQVARGEQARRVEGVVVRDGGRRGVAGLLVTAYAVLGQQPAALMMMAREPAEGQDGGEGADSRLYGRRRLGSTFTDNDGGFRLVYSAPDSGYDLEVEVSAAGSDCDSGSSQPIAVCRRRQPGAVEAFHISVGDDALRRGGVPTADAAERAEGLLADVAQVRTWQESMTLSARTAFAGGLTDALTVQRRSDEKFESFLRSISAAPAGAAGLGRHVPRGGKVSEISGQLMRDTLTQRLNGSSAAAHVVVPQSVLETLTDDQRNGVMALDDAIVRDILGHDSLRGFRPFLLRPPWSWLCHGPASQDECFKYLEESGVAGDDVVDTGEATGADEDTEPVAGQQPAAVSELIGRLTAPLTAPESGFVTPDRAGLPEVEAGVAGFELRSGPADGPMVYDFHHLRIAFEDVWQELFDGNVVGTAKQLYSKFVELGLDPNEYLIDPDEMRLSIPYWLFNAFDASGKNAQTAPDNAQTLAIIKTFEITPEQLHALTPDQRGELERLADVIAGEDEQTEAEEKALEKSGFLAAFLWHAFQVTRKERAKAAYQAGKKIINFAQASIAQSQSFNQFHWLLGELDKALKEPYRFSVYAANRFGRSVNFGVIATYRQRWQPIAYQVGELVKTVPMAPKEVRRYTKKLTIKQSRAEKEVNNSLSSRRLESQETSRAETEIMQKATRKSNFQLSASGSVNVGISDNLGFSATGSTSTSQDASSESSEVKKEFREAVFKAAEEYKAERTLEINLTDSSELYGEESGEISNPNDELPVTYLFYQLQRRHRVAEHIHKVTPVVMVAQEVPKPHEIDEDWILRHDWILRRVILDDSFLPAMNYVASKVAGDEHALTELHTNLQQQRKTADQLKEQLVEVRSSMRRRYSALERSVAARAEAIDAEEGEGFLEAGLEGLFGSIGDTTSPEAARVREDAARDAYERVVRQEKELQGRLERENTALQTVTDKYTAELSDHLNRRVQISRLRVHLKDNILYYMQAVWSHEPPDQRYFRLHEVRVPKLVGKKSYKLVPDPDAIPMPPTWTKPHKLQVTCDIDPDFEYDALTEVADLDNMLGFKGNYMIFPLRQGNDLTDFMMTPYLDPIAGLSDPDPLGSWTLDDLAKYVCCLKSKLSEQAFNQLRPGLAEAHRRIAAHRNGEQNEIIVPTDSLYIEALPGTHPILEDFKLRHRAIDVKKVQAETRGLELENLRMAARLLAGEHEDPQIDKKIVIEGDAGTFAIPEEA